MHRKLFVSVLFAITLIGCAAPAETETAATTAATETAAPAPATETVAATPETKPDSYYVDKVVELETEAGTISLRFYPDVAPNHVRNFIDRTEAGDYDGTKFHRIIPGFVIQGGDPNTRSDDSSTWGTGGSGPGVKAEFNSVHHGRGILSMARSMDPDSARSQFFICVDDADSLDNNYTVFGKVVSGMDVVDKIVAGPKGGPRGDMATKPVAIKKATVRAATAVEKGPAPK
ncbi:MAG: peptidylprolyl isomerase [Acidobacteria bacterium]|nr:peptidylprolyl isomerase [Acidobacteriota bacterium]